MKIINMSNPDETKMLALGTHSSPANVTAEDAQKLEKALEIAWGVFGEELGRELCGIYVYAAVDKQDVDAFVYDDGERVYMFISDLAASLELSATKYFFCEALFSAYVFGVEKNVDILALAEALQKDGD